jgi:hypothetical protein
LPPARTQRCELAARGIRARILAEEHVLELHHAGVREQQRRIVAGTSGLERRPVAARQEFRADLRLDVLRDLRMLLQEVPRVVLALADALAVVAVPGARLLDDVPFTPMSMISPSREMPWP